MDVEEVLLWRGCVWRWRGCHCGGGGGVAVEWLLARLLLLFSLHFQCKKELTKERDALKLELYKKK